MVGEINPPPRLRPRQGKKTMHISIADTNLITKNVEIAGGIREWEAIHNEPALVREWIGLQKYTRVATTTATKYQCSGQQFSGCLVGRN